MKFLLLAALFLGLQASAAEVTFLPGSQLPIGLSNNIKTVLGKCSNATLTEVTTDVRPIPEINKTEYITRFKGYFAVEGSAVNVEVVVKAVDFEIVELIDLSGICAHVYRSN